MAPQFESVDDYISSFPSEVQTVLQAARQTIHAAAPGLQESMSYSPKVLVERLVAQRR